MADKSTSIAYENLTAVSLKVLGNTVYRRLNRLYLQTVVNLLDSTTPGESAAIQKRKLFISFWTIYQFDALWRKSRQVCGQAEQIPVHSDTGLSTYTDFPKAIQIYNHYRKHWIGAYLQEYGCRVIPTISWSTPDSYAWCFDGEPDGGTVAVSSVGCMNSKGKKCLFLSGYNAMIERLHPESIIFTGQFRKNAMVTLSE